mgnify:CR=1 FL=1
MILFTDIPVFFQGQMVKLDVDQAPKSQVWKNSPQ